MLSAEKDCKNHAFSSVSSVGRRAEAFRGFSPIDFFGSLSAPYPRAPARTDPSFLSAPAAAQKRRKFSRTRAGSFPARYPDSKK
jgi:hypothetical protein